MAERKVLIKYFPKNFDHQRIVKRGRGKDKLMMVRNMLPMSLRCNTCANYLYIGTKFNMRMEICNEQVYLGIKVFRFYFKCTYCYAEITFKTDPKNHDYVVETGGTRNYEAIKDAQQAQKYLKRLKVNQKQQNSMKYLQNKSYDSKRQMQLMEALQDIKNLNRRQAVIDPEDLLKNLIYEEEEEQQLDEQQQAELQREWQERRKSLLQQKGFIIQRAQQPVQQVEQTKKDREDENCQVVEKMVHHKQQKLMQYVSQQKSSAAFVKQKVPLKQKGYVPTSSLSKKIKKIVKPSKKQVEQQ